MSWQGPVGFNGPQGFPGCTGPNGLQGTPYGPPGTTFYKGGVLPSYVQVSTSGQTINISAATSGTYYDVRTGSMSINAGTYYTPVSTDSGVFWSFKNNSGVTLTVTFYPPVGIIAGFPAGNTTGDGAVYNGSLYASTFTFAPGSGFTFVYSCDPVTAIQYFIVI